MTLICCCSLAGTQACKNCPSYIREFGHSEESIPQKIEYHFHFGKDD